MKKTLFIAMLSLAVTLSVTAHNTKKEIVNIAVTESFNSDFRGAMNVSWENLNGTFIVNFTQDNHKLIAYYNEEGILLGAGRYIPNEYLPLSVSFAIEKRYGKVDIVNAMEYSAVNESTSYYLQIRNQKFNKVVKVTTTGSIEIIKK